MTATTAETSSQRLQSLLRQTLHRPKEQLLVAILQPGELLPAALLKVSTQSRPDVPFLDNSNQDLPVSLKQTAPMHQQ